MVVLGPFPAIPAGWNLCVRSLNPEFLSWCSEDAGRSGPTLGFGRSNEINWANARIGGSFSLRTNTCMALQSQGRGPQCAHFSERMSVPGLLRALHVFNDLINEPVLHGLGCGHEAVAVRILFDSLERMSGMLDQDLVHALFDAAELSRMNLDVRRRALHPG